MVNNHELGLSLIKIHTPTDLTPHVQFLYIAGRILVLFLFSQQNRSTPIPALDRLLLPALDVSSRATRRLKP